MSAKPHVDKKCLIEKFPGKGGWSYVPIPEIPQNPDAPFGWVKVKGSIDGYKLKHFKLMPMGNGQLFLPIKAAIRKKIGKKEGDQVHVILHLDEDALELPEEIQLCFQNEAKKVFIFFNSLKESEQQAYIDWIYQSKTEDTKVQRIVHMMEKLAKRKKFYDD